MDQQEFIISFDHSNAADANVWAMELREYILDETEDAEVEQKRTNENAQDLGTLLHLATIGAPALAAVAKALSAWLIKRQEASITIKTPQGEVVATNLTNRDVMKLAEMLLSQRPAVE